MNRVLVLDFQGFMLSFRLHDKYGMNHRQIQHRGINLGQSTEAWPRAMGENLPKAGL
jgi:hypothetical protein